MPLHPQAQALVDAANRNGAPLETDDYRAMRSAYALSTAIYKHPTPPLDSIANLMIPGAHHSLPIRVYRPRNKTKSALPVMVFFHGGGWVVGNLNTHDHMCRYLAAHSGWVVIAVDYRLAPEHPFPAGIEDACSATRWIAANAGELKLKVDHMVVGGDSAGGNFAAVVAQTMRNEGGVSLRHQILIYPAVDFTADNQSLRENGEGLMLTRKAMEQLSEWYLPNRIARTDPRASPLLDTDLSGLPPALIIAAGYDPLRDEAIAYAEGLKHAGVTVQLSVYEGMIHGFARMGAKLDDGIKVLGEIADYLKAEYSP